MRVLLEVVGPMSENTIVVPISDDEREFMSGQIASGKYVDEVEMMHAGLAALEREANLGGLQVRAEMDADVKRSEYMAFHEPDDLARYFADSASTLRSELISSKDSGTSSRQIPEIMADIKAKLRADGSL